MIPLMKNTFLNEYDTKKALSEFILQTNKFSMGEKCKEFENIFSKKQKRKYSVLFNSGGSANLAMLQSLSNIGILKTNDLVGFSGLTWSTNVMPIIQMRMAPVPIDCSKETLNVMSYNLEKILKVKKIHAVFLTNALGFTGDLPKIKEICESKNIILLEDNCEALGTELPEGKAGNFGLASSFSFFVAHHMSTIEGGMVCTDNENLYEMLTIVRANGWDRNLNAKQQFKIRKKYNIKNEFQAKYTFYDLGYNLRPTEINGFLGIYQMNYLENNIKKREANYLLFEKIISKNPDLLLLKHDHIKILSNFALPIVCRNEGLRDKYFQQFAGAGIEIRPMIAGNIQLQPFYKKYVNEIYELTGADFFNNCSFYCGNYPELDEGNIETISSCLRKI